MQNGVETKHGESLMVHVALEDFLFNGSLYCWMSTTNLTQGESGGNNREVYRSKQSALCIHEWTKR